MEPDCDGFCCTYRYAFAVYTLPVKKSNRPETVFSYLGPRPHGYKKLKGEDAYRMVITGLFMKLMMRELLLL
jgi:hypothetical protein